MMANTRKKRSKLEFTRHLCDMRQVNTAPSV